MIFLLVGSEIEENLAIRYLASSLIVHGHSATVFPYYQPRDSVAVAREIRRTRAEVVAISIAFQSQASAYLSLAEEIRRQGFEGHIVAGGHFPTFEFQRILESYPAIDSVGRFDGEETIVALADVLGGGTPLSLVPNLVYRSEGGIHENACRHVFPDLDQLPFPLRSRQPRHRFGENIAALVTSRGCWHSACLYCCIGGFHREKEVPFALRSPENVAREIAELIEKYNVRVFQFQDDNFTLATKKQTLQRFECLSRAFRNVGIDTSSIAFFVKARPDVIDKEVADGLRKLGCVGVFLGVENASKNGLKSLKRAANIEHVEEAFSALRARDIAITYNLLIFYPAAVPAEYSDNVDFVTRHPDTPFDLGRAEIVAGSPLERRVRALGLLRGSWPWWDYVLVDQAMQRVVDCFRDTLRYPYSSFAATTFEMVDISYHTAVILKLCPGVAARSFARHAKGLIRSWNTTVIHAMQRVFEMSLEDEPAASEALLRQEIARRASELQPQVEVLRGAMKSYQRTHRIFRRFGVEDALDRSRLLRRMFGGYSVNEDQ